MHIMLIGNLTVGHHALGPFDSYEAAEDYAKANVADGFWFVFEVYPPEEPDAP